MPNGASATPAPLSYQRRGPRRRVPRRVWLTALLVVAAIGAWRFGPTAFDHLRYLQSQRECLEWTVAEGTVAYEDDPQRAEQLLSTGQYVGVPQSIVRH